MSPHRSIDQHVEKEFQWRFEEISSNQIFRERNVRLVLLSSLLFSSLCLTPLIIPSSLEIGMIVLLPLQLPFQLIGFSYYSLSLSLLFPPQTPRNGKCKSEKKKNSIDKNERFEEKEEGEEEEEENLSRTSRLCSARLMSSDDDG